MQTNLALRSRIPTYTNQVNLQTLLVPEGCRLSDYLECQQYRGWAMLKKYQILCQNSIALEEYQLLRVYSFITFHHCSMGLGCKEGEEDNVK